MRPASTWSTPGSPPTPRTPGASWNGPPPSARRPTGRAGSERVTTAKMMARFVLVPAFLLLLPAGAFPQQLGDAAAREREKKAKAAPPAKAAPAFSNDDLASEKEKKRKKEEAEARGEKVEPEAPAEPASTDEGRPAADGRKRLSDP